MYRDPSGQQVAGDDRAGGCENGIHASCGDVGTKEEESGSQNGGCNVASVRVGGVDGELGR